MHRDRVAGQAVVWAPALGGQSFPPPASVCVLQALYRTACPRRSDPRPGANAAPPPPGACSGSLHREHLVPPGPVPPTLCGQSPQVPGLSVSAPGADPGSEGSKQAEPWGKHDPEFVGVKAE